MEVKQAGIMEKNKSAIEFLLNNFEGNSSYSEQITHMLSVGEILKFQLFKGDIIEASYLYKLPEISSYDLTSISKQFGGRIGSLILTTQKASSKREQIKQSRDLPVNNRALILADLIVELSKAKEKILDNQILNLDQEYYENMLDVLEDGIDDIRIINLSDKLYDLITDVFYRNRFKLSDEELSEIEKTRSLKEYLTCEKKCMVSFSNKKPLSLINIFNNILDNKIYKIKYNNKGISGSLNLYERDIIILGELDSRFITNLSKHKSMVISDDEVFNKIDLIISFIKKEIIKRNDAKHYMDILKGSFNLVSFGNKKVKEETLREYIDVLNEYNYGNVNIESNSKIVETLIPIVNKNQAKELKYIIEKK